MSVIINFLVRLGTDLSLDLGGLVMRGINMEYKGGPKLRYKVRHNFSWPDLTSVLRSESPQFVPASPGAARW